MESTIRLFRAIIVETKKKKKPSKEILTKTIKSGFILSEEIIANYHGSELDRIISNLIKIVGLSGKQANSSFHKSWKKIKEANIEQLVLEQIIHYITTYGYEKFGIYDENTVYIPEEILKIPALKNEKLSLIFIRGYTKEELKQKILDFLESGIALKDETLKDVLDIATYLKFDLNEIEKIRNREAKIALYDYMGMVPENPVELLRYLIFKATNKTLLIKDKTTIDLIKARNNIDILGIINKYSDHHSLDRLGEIFYRFKPLFLAFRTSKGLKAKINRIRKLAVKNHKPMSDDFLNSVTRIIKNGEISKEDLETALSKASTFRKIRLAYALSYRTKNSDSILYKIRNGKSYATDFSFTQKIRAKKALLEILNSISDDLIPNVSEKRIYIPPKINYALPATEKQFTGMFPSGTSVNLPKDMIVGVYWENVNGNRIDLDLSIMNVGEKFGWDGLYRDDKGGILFSGDMTDAYNGASEMFYISRQKEGSYLVFLNYYNFDSTIPVPFKIFVASKGRNAFGRNYLLTPEEMVTHTWSTANQKQKMLGMLRVTENGSTFFFSESNLGKSITISHKSWVENARKYLIHYIDTQISFDQIISKAGAKLVKNKSQCDIDLSPENLEKDTFTKLLSKFQVGRRNTVP